MQKTLLKLLYLFVIAAVMLGALPLAPSAAQSSEPAAAAPPAAPDAWLPNVGMPGTLDMSFRSGGGANGVVNAIAIQPDGQILIVGDFTKYDYDTATRNGIARVSANGLLDLTFEPGTGFPVESTQEVFAVALQPDGKILVGGYFNSYNGVERPGIARLNADGSLDTTFDPGAGGQVYALAIQPDGKIIAGGNISNYPHYGIVRFNADGSLDTSFDPGTGTGSGSKVYALALQPDGKILIGGEFSSYNGTPRNGIARVNADGTLDTTFDPGSGVSSLKTLALQPDGKILIGGWFGSYNGTPRNGIARVNADGTLDTLFNPGSGVSPGPVKALALQPDGKIVIGGNITSYNGVARNGIARVSAYGALDTTFDPGDGTWLVTALAVQPDGKILIGGDFWMYDTVLCSHLARANADGSLDMAFQSGGGANNAVTELAVQPDGKILIGGYFSSYNGVPRPGLARLNVDGSLDATFAPTLTGSIMITALALQPDGKILIGGGSGVGNHGLARLNPDGSMDNTFVPDGGFSGGATGVAQAFALQPDGKIVVAIDGWFQWEAPVARYLVARLNADGTLDTTFDPSAWAVPEDGGWVGSAATVAILPNGQIILGGDLSLDDGPGGPPYGVSYSALLLTAEGALAGNFGGAMSYESN